MWRTHSKINNFTFFSFFPFTIFKNVEYDANEVMGDYMKSVYDEDKKRMTRKLCI